MSSTATEVRVEIRGVQLAEAVAFEASDTGVFIPLDDPPPVRSILAIFEGDEAPRAFEVTSVVEVPAEGGARGLIGRFVEPDALARFARVGTEHLADGEAPSGPEGAEERDGANDEAPGIQMAMPAPVVVDSEESEAIDVDAPDSTSAETRQAESEGASAEAEPDPDADTSDNGEGERKGKRRRGRKRR
jgi:hypothetical protein